MNTRQKILLGIFLPLTALILALDNIYPGARGVYYVKFTTVVALFLSATLFRKKHREQLFMLAALIFEVVGDFFLVFSNTIDGLGPRVFPLGMLGFMIAYIFLSVVYGKRSRPGKKELAAAIPVLAVFVPVFLSLYPHVNGVVFPATLLFSLTLTGMTWLAFCTRFAGYYSQKASLLIAVSGYLMFLCDMGVAVSQFHPAFAGHFTPWLKNIIWGTYIPGWTLLAVLVAEDDLLAQ